MKKLIALCLALVLALSMVGCGNSEQSEESNDFDGNFTLKATIIEIADNYFIVEPVEGSWELNSADRIEVPMEKMSPSPEPQVGDILEVVYRGEIMETDPARLTDVQSIRVIEQAVAETPNANIPSVIYNGKVYSTTGKQMPVEVDESAYVGEITSVVPLSQWPTEEGQANFGEVGTPYAVTSEGFVVLMNNEWTVFEIIE